MTANQRADDEIGATLNAGPKMDAEISRVVFGEPVEVFCGVARLIRDCGRPPRYSQDIAAAWDVVIDLRSRQYSLELHARFNGVAARFIHRNEEQNIPWHGFWEAAQLREEPLAICRAALKALAARQAADDDATGEG